MLQRPALTTGEDCAVDALGKLRFAENQTAPCAPQSFVCRGSNDVSKLEWRRMVASRYKSCDMCHIHQHIALVSCLPFIAVDNISEGVKVQGTAICRSPNDYKLWIELIKLVNKIVCINPPGFVCSIVDEVKNLTTDIHRRAVGQMPAVIKAHRKDGISGFQYGQICRNICVRAAVRLHIDMIVSLEHLLPHFAAVFLQLIYILASAIISASVAGVMHGGVSF